MIERNGRMKDEENPRFEDYFTVPEGKGIDFKIIKITEEHIEWLKSKWKGANNHAYMFGKWCCLCPNTGRIEIPQTGNYNDELESVEVGDTIIYIPFFDSIYVLNPEKLLKFTRHLAKELNMRLSLTDNTMTMKSEANEKM